MFAHGIQAQVLVDCSNLHLSADTFYISHTQNTTVVGDLHYLDTNMAVYPVLRLILEDTSMITSPNIMVLSFLAYPIDSLEQFNFPIHFKTTNYPGNTVVSGWFHVYDSDMPGDSIVTCYFPIKLFLQNPLSVIEPLNNAPAVTIYPNPINNCSIVQFENTKGEYFSFRLYDLNGKLVYNKVKIGEGKTLLEVPDLMNGMYLYRLSGEWGTIINGKAVLNK
ncbi:MAG: T9SS type A sorting domain-containing protein [Bacteroidia bacterium]|nr:T9SS type A sorting domain-containing protein [Bacteroidia bacterium]